MITISIGHFVIAALVLVGLMALTMRSVVLRDRAVIRRREDAALQASYEQRWRNRNAA